MKIVDTQWHEPAPYLDIWDKESLELRRKVQTEVVLTAMDAVGVDSVLMFTIEDQEWAEQLAAQYPNRFAVAPMITAGNTPGNQNLVIKPDAPDLEQRIADLKNRPGVVAVRILGAFFPEEVERMKSGGNDRAFAACEKVGLPVYLFVCGHAELAVPVAEKYPNLNIIIDHLGIKAPPLEQPDDPMWKHLPAVLALAKYPNVSLKLCGAPALSKEAYPYKDVWPYIRQLVDAFGAERLMWASDIPRFRGRIGFSMRVAHAQQDYPGKHTYAESLAFYKDTDMLSQKEKELILGGSIRKILNWPVSDV